jgi:hypothetical protein
MHEHAVIDGLDAAAVSQWVTRFGSEPFLTSIEQYRPHKKLDSDIRMVQAEKYFLDAMPFAQTVNNTGVRKLAPRWSLDIFGIGRFPTTHHQDLQAAARILYLGGIKNHEANRVLSTVVKDFMDGKPWMVEEIR